MKLSLIFSCFILLVACSTTKELNTLKKVTKIDQKSIFYADGKKTLLSNKEGEAIVIYLVRHAEKAKDGGKDPLLTTQGEARAVRLGSILREAGIDRVYSTVYQRTQSTAKPTADILGTGIRLYDARDLNSFAKELKDKDGKVILVVGHSNTTPTLVNALIGQEEFAMIEESEYGNLYRITISENGKGQATLLKY
ncbi:MAG: histidine phosphatase family protein [Saprospiraceae bacterium]